MASYRSIRTSRLVDYSHVSKFVIFSRFSTFKSITNMRFYFAFVFVLVAAVQAAPSLSADDDDFFSAATSGDWDKVHELFGKQLNSDDTWKPLTAGSVKSLKPVPGGQVYGESEYTFHSSSNVNGQKSEKSGGHKVINDNGKVYEYDFNPKIKNS